MDPLDKILALVLSHTIAAQRVKDTQSATANSTTEREQRINKRKE